MRSQRFVSTAFIAVAVLAACSDGALAPRHFASGPGTEIRDGAHGNGNAAFHFLPPLVPAPATLGLFDASADPSVSICEWVSGACGSTLATWTMNSGPNGETVKIDTVAGAYDVKWRTRDFTLTVGATYRVSVRSRGSLVGWADVIVASSNKDLKNVDTNEYLPLVDGHLLNIRFRVDQSSDYLGSWQASISGSAVSLDLWMTPAGAVGAGTFASNPRESLRILGAPPAHPDWLYLYRGQDDATMLLRPDGAGGTALEYWEGGCARIVPTARTSSSPSSTDPGAVIATGIDSDYLGTWSGTLPSGPVSVTTLQSGGTTTSTGAFGAGTEALLPLGFAAGPPREMYLFRPQAGASVGIFADGSGQVQLEYWTNGCASVTPVTQ